MSVSGKSQVLVMMNPTQDAPGVVNVGKTPGGEKEPVASITVTS